MMELINFQGLNCYYNCILSIANYLGADYVQALASLWSETDFKYDAIREVFLTKRLIKDLQIMGVEFENMFLDENSEKEADSAFKSIGDGELVIIGMNAFYIPWNPLYTLHHGPHYFFCKILAEKRGWLTCYDPTYDSEGMEISFRELSAHIFDISKMFRIEKSHTEKKISLKSEAQRVLLSDDNLKKKLIDNIALCKNKHREGALIIARYVDALINNRYMYRHCLKKQQEQDEKLNLFFCSEFFLKWTAIKNGLYKASFCSKNEEILSEIENLLNEVINMEETFARSVTAKKET